MKGKDMPTIKDKVEQGIVPIKAELIWFVILLMVVAAAIYGMKAAYNMGYRNGVYTEKVGDLEDIIFNQEIKNGQR